MPRRRWTSRLAAVLRRLADSLDSREPDAGPRREVVAGLDLTDAPAHWAARVRASAVSGQARRWRHLGSSAAVSPTGARGSPRPPEAQPVASDRAGSEPETEHAPARDSAAPSGGPGRLPSPAPEHTTPPRRGSAPPAPPVWQPEAEQPTRTPAARRLVLPVTPSDPHRLVAAHAVRPHPSSTPVPAIPPERPSPGTTPRSDTGPPLRVARSQPAAVPAPEPATIPERARRHPPEVAPQPTPSGTPSQPEPPPTRPRLHDVPDTGATAPTRPGHLPDATPDPPVLPDGLWPDLPPRPPIRAPQADAAVVIARNQRLLAEQAAR